MPSNRGPYLFPMKRIQLLALAILTLCLAETPPPGHVHVLFWNVENFFDWRNDSTSVSDAEFSSYGTRHWTRKRFYAKCNAISKAVLWIASQEGKLPEIIALAEVENGFVLRRLIQATALCKTDYKPVHFNSPDHRGIDVALLYRSSLLDLLDARPCRLYNPEDASPLGTRDILLCRFRFRPESEDFAVLVNHHPSKYGGTAESEPRRKIAVERLRQLTDSLTADGIHRIIAIGDFNDTPDNPLFGLLEENLVPLHRPFFLRGEGTIKYNGRWDLIDHAYVSPCLVPPGDSTLPMELVRIPFLLTEDPAHFGEKPLRTYVGPRYTAGVSDHLPILLRLRFPP